MWQSWFRRKGSVPYENQYWSYFKEDKEKLIKIQFFVKFPVRILTIFHWLHSL